MAGIPVVGVQGGGFGVWGVPARGPRCSVFGGTREGALLWRVGVDHTREASRERLWWQVQVLVHGFVCTCREEMFDDFPP